VKHLLGKLMSAGARFREAVKSRSDPLPGHRHHLAYHAP